MNILTGPTEFVSNRDQSSAIPPDRFTPLAGHNNYRSGKIASFDQLKLLKKKYGIKHVVNLALDSMKAQSDPNFDCGWRMSGGKVDRAALCEPKWAAKLGMSYLPVYIGTKPPSADNWAKIKALLTEGNTLIHCTHGVDRTGAVGGRWRREITPELPDREILDYTYSFGGQWKMTGDPNQHLRAWMLGGTFDPALRKRVEWSFRWPKIKLGGAVLLVLGTAFGLRMYTQRRKK
jgi:hypothetical protein